jgi:two-component system, cell cycle response regulator DivK
MEGYPFAPPHPRCCLLPPKEIWTMLGDTSEPSGPTVLIVEDNELTLMLLIDALQYQGYTVFTTRLGGTALEFAHRHKPDVILMDIQLPDISGMEAARQLKEDELTRMIPIIAVTAFAMSGDEKKILASGCDAYISKPFSVAELLKLVERWTTNRT